MSVRALRYIESGKVAQPRRHSLDRLAEAVGLDLADAPWRTGGEGPARPAGGDTHDIRVLGPLTVSCEGQPVELPLKQRTLLGLLAIQPNRVVSQAEMTEVLWSGEAPPSSLGLLHTYMARLRRTLEGGPGGRGDHRRVTTVRGGYSLSAEPAGLDLLRFEEYTAKALGVRESEPALALELFGRAFQYWRGPVLEDVPALRQHPVVVAIGQHRFDMVIEFANLALCQKRHAVVVKQLMAAAYEEPLHEGVQGRLMLALAGSGQKAAALRLFSDLREQFHEELGVEPSEEIWAVRRSILAQPGEEGPARPARARGGPDRAAPVQTSPPVRSATSPAQIPPVVRPFVGRRAEMAALDRLLARQRRDQTAVAIATVYGPPEQGKTALAVHWAHETHDWFPDGQLYADLRGGDAAVGEPLEPLSVLGSFLRSLGVAKDRIPADLAESSALFRTLLAGRYVLVLLDDAGTSAQVRPLLPGTPGNLVLVTSQHPLPDLVVRNGATPLELDVLSVTEARELLDAFLGASRTAAEPEATAALAEVCGRRPLALRHTAAQLAARPNASIREWVRTTTVRQVQSRQRRSPSRSDGDAGANGPGGHPGRAAAGS
ncbi:putative transcriptional regulator [Actinacidiphila reveromycinica]|uniref:Putative transcriptional regulator n=2 Tax=Actinacidiphila reveromycinica TaxID=659352 RepID=A0A7U3VQT3_9ACTN|nr:putative transcriptional regulator [Streptomyces sp. SN-593]